MSNGEARASGGPVLTIDRGNSTLDCMLHDPAGSLRQRFAAMDVEGPAALLHRLRQEGRLPAHAAGATVVEGGLAGVEAELARHQVRLTVAGRDVGSPLRLDYFEPARLGVDRWLGAFAAWRRFGPAIVVDCGTALTVNLVGERGGDGVFLGGAIGPGFATMAAGLRQRAPALPPAEPGAAVALPARDPRSAVAAGVTFAFCGAVERLVAELAGAAGLAAAPVVVTGGEAELYLRHGRLQAVHVPDLVHQGLLWLLRQGAPT